MTTDPRSALERLTRWRDVGDGPVGYTAGNEAFAADVVALLSLLEWRPISEAPKDGARFLAVVDGVVSLVRWGKTSHVPLYGFCHADQGPEDADLCDPICWMPLPPAPTEDKQ